MTPRTAQGPGVIRIATWFAGGNVGRSTANLVKGNVFTDIAVVDYLPRLESSRRAPVLGPYSGSFVTRPCAGKWGETEHERRTVLDDTAPELLPDGPDTWSTVWAGMDVVKVLRDDYSAHIGPHPGDTARMDPGDLPSAPQRECHQTTFHLGAVNPRLGN